MNCPVRGFKLLSLRTVSEAAIAATLLPGIALAQSANAPEPPAAISPETASAGTAPPATQATDEGDIVVTANKREENLNKVGLTVTAFGKDLLEKRQIASLADVASAVPGLAYSVSANNTPILTLRGVGFNESSLGVYPAVSVYIDQAPLPFPVLASHTAYDLQRIEVLKGPQGTLFGQNSTGGAINYIASKPTAKFEAGGDISYGRFNQIMGNAFVSGPISDTLRGRIAVTGTHADGWQRSYTRPNDRNGKQDVLAGRTLLDWTPSERIRFSVNLNGWRDRSEPQAAQYIAYRPQNPTPPPQALVYPLSPENPRAADWNTSPNEPRGDRRFYQSTLRTDFDLTDDLTLTSLTNYVHFKQDMTIDLDGTSLISLDLVDDQGKISSFSQELRLANNSSSAFRFVGGAYYEKSKVSETQIINYPDNSNAFAFGILGSGTFSSQRIRNAAAFLNVEYDISPQLTLKGGARYTNSRNRAQTCGFDAGTGTVNAFWNFLGTVLGSVPFTPLSNNVPPLERCFALDENNVPAGDPFQGTLAENNVSWRAGADFEASNTTLFYANVSRGYKAGSFPVLAGATEVQFQPVVQESVTALEAGVKTGLFDRRVQVNAAAFYYSYKDKQILGKLDDLVFGILDTLINVPKSRVMGVEADVTIRPVRAITLAASGTYLSTKIQNYRGFDAIGEERDARGEKLPFAPKFSYSVDGEYRTPAILTGGSTFAGFTVSGKTKTDTTIAGSSIEIPPSPLHRTLTGLRHPYTTEGYTLVDARLGYERDDGSWRLMLWGRNIFNKYYWNNVVTPGDFNVRYAGRPATYGVTAGFKLR